MAKLEINNHYLSIGLPPLLTNEEHKDYSDKYYTALYKSVR